MKLFADIPDAVIRVAVWAVVVPVAVVAVAPQWLDMPGGELPQLVSQLAYLAIGIVATLWSAAVLRPRLGIVIEDAFGRRSDLAHAASSTTATTYALFGLAFVCFNTPVRFVCDLPALAALSGSVGRVLLVLGALFLAITVRSVIRRNGRETQRRVVAQARAEVGKSLGDALVPPPRYPPATW